MSYAPPPYVPPASAADPTNVMGRRISAYLIDMVVPTMIAVVVAIVVWFGNAQELDKSLSGNPYTCAEANFEDRQSSFDGDSSITCFETDNTIWIASNDDSGGAFLVGFMIWLFVPINLFFIQGVSGASIGKRMLGLRVVRGDGALVGFGWNALRTLLLWIPDSMCAGLVGLITACATKPHRRVGDMAAGTYVVRAASVGIPIETIPAYSAAPSQWAPPPMGGPVYGAPGSAPAPWGATNTAPGAGASIPPAWGVQPEPASASIGADVVAPTPTPATQLPAAAVEPVAPVVVDPTQPRWDDARKAYIAWEPSRGSWMQHDTTTNEWKPI